MKQMMIYIHGFGSDRNSRKYLNLKQYFGDDYNLECLEWKNEDQIDELLTETNKSLQKHENLIIIGDSTGANFAYQLRKMRQNSGLKSDLILTSPLLNKNFITADLEFPENLKNYLVNISRLDDMMIIATPKDETVNQDFVFGKLHLEARIHSVDDNHRLENFEISLPAIRSYIENKEKFKNVPLEEDTRLFYRIQIQVEDLDALYEHWAWDGTSGYSVIFAANDVENMKDEEILGMIRRIFNNEDGNVSRVNAEYVFVNFGFEMR